MEPIEFTAILPSIQAAIRFHGDGGARIQLDIDEPQRMQIYKLNELKGIEFRVTIAPIDENNKDVMGVNPDYIGGDV